MTSPTWLYLLTRKKSLQKFPNFEIAKDHRLLSAHFPKMISNRLFYNFWYPWIHACWFYSKYSKHLLYNIFNWIIHQNFNHWVELCSPPLASLQCLLLLSWIHLFFAIEPAHISAIEDICISKVASKCYPIRNIFSLFKITHKIYYTYFLLKDHVRL